MCLKSHPSDPQAASGPIPSVECGDHDPEEGAVSERCLRRLRGEQRGASATVTGSLLSRAGLVQKEPLEQADRQMDSPAGNPFRAVAT